MNEKLKASVDALVAETTESSGKLASIKTYLNGLPALVAAAVADALAANNVDEEAAATSIDAARDAISGSVDDTLAAIEANPAPDEEPVDEPQPEPAPPEPPAEEPAPDDELVPPADPDE